MRPLTYLLDSYFSKHSGIVTAAGYGIETEMRTDSYLHVRLHTMPALCFYGSDYTHDMLKQVKVSLEEYAKSELERMCNELRRYVEYQAKQFPILGESDWRTSISWMVAEPHRMQIQRNHSQPLERLAERGGLSATELYVAMIGGELFDIDHSNPDVKRKARYYIDQQERKVRRKPYHNGADPIPTQTP